MQQVSCSSSLLPTEEWVYIEDYYSDEEQSGIVEAAPTGSKDQLSMVASRSVCLALTDAVVESVDLMAGLTVSPLSAVTPALGTALVAASKSGAPDLALSSNLLMAAARLAQSSPFLAARFGPLHAQYSK